MLLMVILGGLDTTWGPAIGAAGLLVLPELISGFQGFRLIAYGAVMLGCLYVMPQGIAGYFGTRRNPSGHAGAAVEEASQVKSTRVASIAESLLPRFATAPGQPLVTIDKLTKHFGGLIAVDQVDLTIESGVIHSLIGPNGAGKTTLVNLISGFYQPTHGQIRFRGRSTRGCAAHHLAPLGIARTFQASRLFPQLSALENVMVGCHHQLDEGFGRAMLHTPKLRDEERRAQAFAQEVLDFVGFPHSPHVLAGTLAFGHQRLVEIARALATRPTLLLLDEPAAGLSAAEMAELTRLMTRIKTQGVTTLLIEHHMGLVMGISDQVTVLDYGRKIAAGKPADIRANPQVIEAYLGHRDG